MGRTGRDEIFRAKPDREKKSEIRRKIGVLWRFSLAFSLSGS